MQHAFAGTLMRCVAFLQRVWSHTSPALPVRALAQLFPVQAGRLLIVMLSAASRVQLSGRVPRVGTSRLGCSASPASSCGYGEPLMTGHVLPPHIITSGSLSCRCLTGSNQAQSQYSRKLSDLQQDGFVDVTVKARDQPCCI